MQHTGLTSKYIIFRATGWGDRPRNITVDDAVWRIDPRKILESHYQISWMIAASQGWRAGWFGVNGDVNFL